MTQFVTVLQLFGAFEALRLRAASLREGQQFWHLGLDIVIEDIDCLMNLYLDKEYNFEHE